MKTISFFLLKTILFACGPQNQDALENLRNTHAEIEEIHQQMET